MRTYEYITVVANGAVHDGWESVQVEWTMKDPEVNCLLTTTEIGPFTEAPVFDKWNYPPGSVIEVYATPEGSGAASLIFWGTVYSYEPKADAESHTVTLVCKTTTNAWAMAGVESATGVWQDTTDEAFVTELVNAVGYKVKVPIGLISMTSQGPRTLPYYMIRQGATNYQASMDVLVRNQKSLMATREGALVIHDGVPFKMSGAVVQGENILRMSAKLKDSQYSRIEVIGQNAIQNAYNTGIAPHGIFGTTGKYKKVIDQLALTQSDAIKRAVWEARRGVGEAIQAIVTVPGWRDLDGALWMANQDVYINAPWLQLDCTLRTWKVVMNQDLASGTTTELTLVDPRTCSGYGEISSRMETACDNGSIWEDPIVSVTTAAIDAISGAIKTWF